MVRRSFSSYLKLFRSKERLVDELERALDKVNSENEARKNFLAILAHELRNPLATILSSVELVRLQETHIPEVSVLLQTIDGRVQAMTGMLNDMLDISRISRNTSTLQREMLPLISSIDPSVYTGKGLSPTKNARTVLVVDDNEGAAEALGRLLELRGYAVTLAHNGSEAIRKARQSHPQIIILDIGLPDIDGYEVLRILQGDKNFSPTLIALTGYGQVHDKERALKAGFDFHFTKPVGFKEIEAALQLLPA